MASATERTMTNTAATALEEIRKRHATDEAEHARKESERLASKAEGAWVGPCNLRPQSHDDRATLLTHIAALEAELAKAKSEKAVAKAKMRFHKRRAEVKTEAQLSTRLPDRADVRNVFDEWVEALPDHWRAHIGQLTQRYVERLLDKILALLSGAATPAPTAAHLRRFREQTEAEVFGYVTGVEDAAALYESVNPASDDERIKGSPGAGAMGAVIEYRDKIRELLHAKSPPQGAEE